MDPDTLNAIISGSAALVGALFGGGAAIVATLITNANANKRDDKQRTDDRTRQDKANEIAYRKDMRDLWGKECARWLQLATYLQVRYNAYLGDPSEPIRVEAGESQEFTSLTYLLTSVSPSLQLMQVHEYLDEYGDLVGDLYFPSQYPKVTNPTPDIDKKFTGAMQIAQATISQFLGMKSSATILNVYKVPEVVVVDGD